MIIHPFGYVTSQIPAWIFKGSLIWAPFSKLTHEHDSSEALADHFCFFGCFVFFIWGTLENKTSNTLSFEHHDAGASLKLCHRAQFLDPCYFQCVLQNNKNKLSFKSHVAYLPKKLSFFLSLVDLMHSEWTCALWKCLFVFWFLYYRTSCDDCCNWGIIGEESSLSNGPTWIKDKTISPNQYPHGRASRTDRRQTRVVTSTCRSPTDSTCSSLLPLLPFAAPAHPPAHSQVYFSAP